MLARQRSRHLVACSHALVVVVTLALPLLVSSNCIGDGDINCSGHGHCSRTGRQFNCECFPGWEGAGCNRRTCPTGKAWVGDANSDGTSHSSGAVCSNAVRHCVCLWVCWAGALVALQRIGQLCGSGGTGETHAFALLIALLLSAQGKCNTDTGLCQCNPAYTGAACQRRACRACPEQPCIASMLNPVCVRVRACTCVRVCVCVLSHACYLSGRAVKCPEYGGKVCGGHGMCVTIEDYAQRYNKTDTEAAYKYTQWDRDMVTMCECDEGYTGYHCGVRYVGKSHVHGNNVSPCSVACVLSVPWWVSSFLKQPMPLW